MVLRSVRLLAIAAVMVVGVGAVAEAQVPVLRPQYDLFYNQYTNGPATPAQMYPAPLPAPRWVGHTYFTYQPLLPQEWMNPHSRRYVRSPGHPINYTRVSFW